MKKLFIIFAALGLLAGFSGISYAGIQGSLHDFTGLGWSQGQICLPCHTPHNGELVENAPLWNHDLSDGPYNMYSSPSLDAVIPGEPDGSSKLCLSCHDGTVALDAFGGNPGSVFITGSADLGTDLSNDHPISFVYDDGLANTDGGLFLPSSTTVTIGSGNQTRTGPIEEVMLGSDNRLQCSACHSVHNDFVDGDEYLLKITVEGSAICLACHDK